MTVLLAAVPTCVAGQASDHQDLLKLIPEPLPTGVALQGSPSFFAPDSLYEYMDGGADIFLLYGVHSLMHLDMRDKAVEITVDVFDMGTPDTAFGMYAAERSSNDHFLAIGAEGYRFQGILNFLQDHYYVKIAAFGDGAESVLEPLAEALSKKIGTNPGFPALLAALPAANRKLHSEQFMPNDPLGHAFLSPAYVATYTSVSQESKLFVTLAHDEADARGRLAQLQQHLTKTGTCKPAPEFGEGAIRGNNSFEGNVLALAKGRYLILLLNPASDPKQLLNDLTKGLHE
jgi:hypothetical protein